MAEFADTVYSDQVITDLYARSVATEITNQNFTEDGARTVTIYKPTQVAANDLAGDNQANVQDPDANTTSLVFNQEKDLTVGIPSVQEFQTNVDMQDNYRQQQVDAINEDMSKYVLGLSGDAPGGNTLDFDLDGSNAQDFGDKVREAKVALSEANAPYSGRWMVLPPFYMDLLAEDAGDRLTDNVDSEVEGFIGRYQGFNLYETTAVATNDTPSPSTRQIMFGHERAITMGASVDQFALVPYDRSQYHGALLKMLVVYGAKVVDSDLLGVINAEVSGS
jgi:hypothetical protein